MASNRCKVWRQTNSSIVRTYVSKLIALGKKSNKLRGLPTNECLNVVRDKRRKNGLDIDVQSKKIQGASISKSETNQ